MIIVKIGGGKSINIPAIVKDLSSINEPFIIIHGANAFRDELMQKLSINKKKLTSVSGYESVQSDKELIDIMMMAYAGIQNKRIVELCQQNNINAVGLSGIDGKIIQGERNKGIRIRENGKVMLIKDFSGKPKTVNTSLLSLFLSNGYVPVLTVPIIDENNIAINSENDDIVSLLQKAIHANTVISLIEAPGFLENVKDSSSLVSSMTKTEIIDREQQVSGRMKRKMLALRKLCEDPKVKVIISDGRVEHPIQDALAGKGTTIQ